ncbi:hypothetical protein DFJ73DRAFT_773738 [Zopfochytrium polystomum]|nr:hypothetical protein DFJ73DRAFT_773738 [Zopfochytrium polystomum]
MPIRDHAKLVFGAVPSLMLASSPIVTSFWRSYIIAGRSLFELRRWCYGARQFTVLNTGCAYVTAGFWTRPLAEVPSFTIMLRDLAGLCSSTSLPFFPHSVVKHDFHHQRPDVNYGGNGLLDD